MVRFSSLDPIAEARAQVKLRYSRARPVRAPMKPIGMMADRVGRKAGTAKLPPLKQMQLNWRAIVGEQLWRWCQPEKISTAKDGRILTLIVLPQAAPLIQHQSEVIRQRVSVALGGDITAIRIIQGVVRRSGPSEFRRRTRPLTSAEQALIAEKAETVENLRLRAAIVALGEAVLSATE
ncbi:MAG: DUF721 domain-containing protein [Hyphomonas sp.]